LAASKDLYFFDRFFHRGLAWYTQHFNRVHDEEIVIGEICHDYLFSPVAARRIVETLPGVRVMVCLREPVSRARSAYLHMVKHGLTSQDFYGALHDFPELIDHGAYSKHLANFTSRLEPDSVYVSVFDDLQEDPQGFMNNLTDWLGVSRYPLSAEERRPRREARAPRSRVIARLVKGAAVSARDLRLDGVVARLKASDALARILYRPVQPATSTRTDEEAGRLIRHRLGADLERLDDQFALSLGRRWGWTSTCASDWAFEGRRR
jgi:hypothetical protein